VCLDSPIRVGIRAGLPLVIPLAAVAISFGVVARQSLGATAPIVMSSVVFAGASQFAAVSVLAGGGSAAAAIAVGLLLNLRFLPMGFAAARAFRGGPFRRAAEGQAIVDASWAFASRGDGTFDRGILLGATIPQALAWVSGTAIGVVAGSALGNQGRIGLDAVFPAFYLALLVGEVRGPRSRDAAVLGGAITACLISVLPSGLPVFAAVSAAFLGLIPRWRSGS